MHSHPSRTRSPCNTNSTCLPLSYNQRISKHCSDLWREKSVTTFATLLSPTNCLWHVSKLLMTPLISTDSWELLDSQKRGPEPVPEESRLCLFPYDLQAAPGFTNADTTVLLFVSLFLNWPLCNWLLHSGDHFIISELIHIFLEMPWPEDSHRQRGEREISILFTGSPLKPCRGHDLAKPKARARNSVKVSQEVTRTH